MNLAPHGPTHIKRHLATFSSPDDLAPGIWETLNHLIVLKHASIVATLS